MSNIKGASLEDGIHHDHHHESCSRRDFLARLGLFTAGSAMMLNSTPVQAMQSSSLFRKLARLETNKILVLVQLNGGNDGLNTIVPFTDDNYHNARPTIRLSETWSSSIQNPTRHYIPLTDSIGMHGALNPIQSLWGDGKMGIIQNVGYPDPILSHFSSSDVWLTGSDSDNIGTTGWLGRYLDGDAIEQELQNPLDYPLAVNVGGASSLLFTGPNNNTAFNLSNIGALQEIASKGQVYSTENLPDTAYGNEMRFLRNQINDSFQFSGSISDAYEASSSYSGYEPRQISNDLSVVARLIKGNLGSKIYMVTLDGFDTHTDQPSRHAERMMLLSNAISTFYEDLSASQVSNDVLTMTFSEFGRRVEQNGQGTDHGTAAPVMVFGDDITPGLFGSNPKLSKEDLDKNGNLQYEYDFRSVYTTILTDWFGLSQQEADEVIGLNRTYEKLGFLGSEVTVGAEEPSIVPDTFQLNQNYPNPFNPATTISFKLPKEEKVRLEVFDIQGRKVSTLTNKRFSAGEHQVNFSARGLASGVYIYQLKTDSFTQTKKMTLLK